MYTVIATPLSLTHNLRFLSGFWFEIEFLSNFHLYFLVFSLWNLATCDCALITAINRKIDDQMIGSRSISVDISRSLSIATPRTLSVYTHTLKFFLRDGFG